MKNSDFITFMQDYWPILAPILWELAVRFSPTQHSLSLLTYVWKILNTFFPDKKTGGGTHMVIWLLLLLPLLGHSQNNVPGKMYYSYNVTDTSFVHNTRTNTQSLYGNTGGIYYDKGRNKWRIWNGICPDTSFHNGCWRDLFNEAVAGVKSFNGRIGAVVPLVGDYSAFYSPILSFANELTQTGSTITYGGTRTGTTSVNQNGFNLTYTGSGKITTNGLNLGNNGPSNTAIGDITYNSGFFIGKTSAADLAFMQFTGPVGNGVAVYSSGSQFNTYSGLIYDNSFPALTVGGRVATQNTSSNTFAALGIAPASSDPGSVGNGDIWYNSSTNKFRGRQNGISVDLIGTATPAGSNAQIQFNNSGVFGASANLTWNSGGNNAIQIRDPSGTANGIFTFKTLSSTSGGNPELFITTTPPSSALTFGDNVSVSDLGLQSRTTGSGNTVLGMNSGSAVTSGTTNTLIGFTVGNTITTGTHNIGVGDNLDFATSPFSATGSNQVQITDLLTRDSSGEVRFKITRTTCAGAPSGVLAVVAGVLTQCP